MTQAHPNSFGLGFPSSTAAWLLHAFVLLNNHEHLFVETPEANLSAGMRYLNGSYTSYFNRRHRRVGHLLQGRFKSHLVEGEGYSLELSRYIHLNPVRAKIVAHPRDYRWSSFPGYCRANRALEWVTYARVLGEFGRELTQARRTYGQFVSAGLDDPPKSPFAQAVGGLVLGSEKFIARVKGMLDDRSADAGLPQLQAFRRRPSLEKIAQEVSKHFGHDGSAWRPGRWSEDASRAVAAYIARRHFGYSAKEVAAALGYRSHGGVRNAIGRIEEGHRSLQQAATKLFRKLR